MGFHIPTPHLLNLTFSDKAAEPAGEARNEWQIYYALFVKIAERAKERGLTGYTDTTGQTRRFAALPDAYSMKGFLLDEDRLADEQIRDSALAGTLPMGTSLRTLREKGHVRFIDWGMCPWLWPRRRPSSQTRRMSFPGQYRERVAIPDICAARPVLHRHECSWRH